MAVLGIPFNRPPRVLAALPTDEVEIPPPPTPPQESAFNWLIVGLPFAGVLVMAGFYMLGPAKSPLLAIPMLAMSGFSILASVLNMLNQKKQQKEAAEEKDRQYIAILAKKKELLAELRDRQEGYYHDIHPPVTMLLQRARQRESRLWERRLEHDDFLALRLGLGELPSTVRVRAPNADWPMPHLDEAVALADSFRTVPGVPIAVELCQYGPVGIAGPVASRTALARSLLCHLATHHAPNEVNLLAIYAPGHSHDWHWLKWLPHTYALRDQGARRYLANDTDSAEKLLADLLDELQRRKNSLRQQQPGEAQRVTFPWLVLLVEDYDMVRDARGNTAISLLLSEGPTLNATAIFLVDRSPAIPDGCRSVVEIQKDGMVRYAKAGAPEKEEVATQVLRAAPEYTELSDCEQLARSLSPLLVESFGGEGALPGSVRLLNLLEVSAIEQFDPVSVWERAKSGEDFLRVPLGIKRGGHPLYLDLKHTAHGPHGLIGGTTGSGKSELLQTLVAALALTHHPYDVGFVLVDFKGGGAFSVLQDLPHTLGMVTDLGGGLAERALISMRSELKRREHLLEQAGVNDIRHYRSGGGNPPMPRLIVIIDEFAELARSHPDFMAELIGIAQKGRSLGVHLILSTQRPSGAVNPNIWSNAKFRMCLRVESREDSNDMLHRPDASYLPRDAPGRCYLQVGNDEVFDLFQVARVAGRYQKKGSTKRVQQSIKISEVSPLGQRNIIVDTGKTERSETDASTRTEAEVIVEVLQKAAQRRRLKKLPSPWPEPLPATLFLPNLLQSLGYARWDGQAEGFAGGEMCPACGASLHGLPADAAFCPECGEPRVPPETIEPALPPWLSAVVGKMDDPVNQLQDPFILPLAEQDGHLRLFGAAGSGNDILLRTLVFSLAQLYTPAQLHLYLFDFGGAGAALTSVRELPQCGGLFTQSEEEQIRRLFLRLDEELNRRQELFGGAGLDNLLQYRERFGDETPPAIVVVIAGFAAFYKTIEDRPEYDQLQRVLRDGGACDIHLVLAGNRPSDVPSRLASMIARCLTLKLADTNDYPLTTGVIPPAVKAKAEIPPGRGWYGQQVLEFQTALPVLVADESAQVRAMRQEIGQMHERWAGSRPVPIEVLPESIPLEVVLERFRETSAAYSATSVPLGLDVLYLRPVALDIEQDGPHFLIASPPRGGKTTALVTWILATAYLYSPQDFQFVLISLRRSALGTLTDLPHVRARCTSVQQTQDTFASLKEEMTARQQEGRTTPRILVVVDDYGSFAASMRDEIESRRALETLVRNGHDHGFAFVIAGRTDDVGTQDPLQILRDIKANRSGILLKTAESHTNPLSAQFPHRALPPDTPAGRGMLVRCSECTLMQMATSEVGKGVGKWMEEIQERWVRDSAAS